MDALRNKCALEYKILTGNTVTFTNQWEIDARHLLGDMLVKQELEKEKTNEQTNDDENCSHNDGGADNREGDRQTEGS